MSEEVIVKYCSPTLAGLKTGSLFTYSYTRRSEVNNFLKKLNLSLGCKGIRFVPLRFKNKKALIYAYRPASGIRLSTYYILGYGRPNFDKEPVKATSVTVKSNGIIYQYAWKDVVTGASKSLKHIKKGDKVSYIPDSDDGYGWCKVKSGNVTGWVMNKHLNKSGLSSFKVRTLAAKKTATIIKNGKKVGTKVLAKGTKYTEICTIEKGANLGETYISVGSARYFI